MGWVKRGLIFCPDGRADWSQSHAQVPVVDRRNEDELRIYYSTRDQSGRSLTSYIDVSAENPRNILYCHKQPILPLGEPGTFDDCGVMGSWIVNVGKLKYLYYIGWTVTKTVPFQNSIGLAISEDGGECYQKYSASPLFSPTPREPYFTGTSCVIVENGLWKNWYLSCTRWESIDGQMEPFYHLKYAESDDGIHWRRNAQVAIDYKSTEEGGIVKASVIQEQGIYKMWYAFRSGWGYRNNTDRSYRIGYAESDDGINWQRMDDCVKLELSEDGWDSEMLAYPHVVDVNESRYLFYNGNGFGRSGFGYAEWQE